MRWEFSSRLLPECFATFVLNHGCILFGLSMSLPACLIPQWKEEGHHVDTFIESVLGSISVMVVGVSTFISVFLIGKTSRKGITRISLIVYTFGAIVLLLSSSTVWLCIGMVIQSSVASIFSPVTMSYISEVCQKERRSILLASGFICTVIGLSLNYVLNSFITWRFLVVIMIAIALSEFVQTFFIPESNYWYLLVGNKKKARKSILWYEPTLSDEELKDRMEAIAEANAHLNPRESGLFAEILGSLSQKKCLKPFLLGLLINIFRSGDGRLVMGIYLQKIIDEIHTSYDTNVIIRWFGWADILGSFIVLLFVHKIKRKTLILISTVILEIALGLIVVYKYSQQVGHSLPDWVPIFGLYVYVMCVVTSYSSVITIIVSEIQVPTLRPQMTILHNGIGLSVCWLCSLGFPYIYKVLPIQYVFLWIMMNMMATLIILLWLVPETSELEFYENEGKPKHRAISEGSE